MKILIVSFSALAFFGIVLILSRLKIIAQYVHENNKDYLTVRIVALYGLVSKTFVLPESFVDKEVEVSLKEEAQEVEQKEKSSFFTKLKADVLVAKDWLRFFLQSKHVLKKFLGKTIVHELFWNSIIGAGDAALTGKLTGAAWSLKGIIPMLAYHFFTVRCQPIIHLEPVFNRRIIQTEFRCIFSFRVGDAILTVIQLLRYWRTVNPRTQSSMSHKTNKTV